MMKQVFDWRSALNEWLQSNPREIPQELESLRQAFVTRFPRERLRQLTLEEYALGHDDSHNSFCYWLEWETKKLGSVAGGSAAKWGVWWSSKANTWAYNEGMYQSPHDAWRSLTDGLSALLEAAAADDFANLDAIGDQQLGINRNSLRAKPLFMYFPDKFLPISNPAHLAKMAATAQALSGGRVFVGIGAGWNEEEYRSYGWPFPAPKVRIEQLAESIQIMRAMWSGHPTTFQGKHYQINEAYCEPRPNPAPPIVVGGAG
ncbi:MAG: LLM class flavin-dependent oxidoreductase, partial [Candidatus Promineofilum sp.]|nr:LLM class flavin-dependent oxidoreductase [Promineifilum sp.]